jgi:hypothetical protein
MGLPCSAQACHATNDTAERQVHCTAVRIPSPATVGFAEVAARGDVHPFAWVCVNATSGSTLQRQVKAAWIAARLAPGLALPAIATTDHRVP